MRRIVAFVTVAVMVFGGGLALAQAPPSHSAEVHAHLDAIKTHVAAIEALEPTETAVPPTAAPTPTPVPPTSTATSTPVPATATATPTVTPAPPTSTQAPSSSMTHWHAPGAHDGLTAHEHGAAPPDWVNASAFMPMFTHPANTPNEAQTKHTSFKGFLFRDDGVDIYILMHLDTNPNGATSRFHSVQTWARDATGAVSYWDLWADFGQGNETGPHVQPNDSCGSDGTRPIMMVNFQDCTLTFEAWYSQAGEPQWGWDFGFNVQAQYYCGAVLPTCTNGDLTNLANFIPTGQLNATRRVEAAWYANRPHPTGDIFHDQWGRLLSGSNDPACAPGQMRTVGARSYQVLCLHSYIAPTMTSVQFPGNANQQTYPVGGVQLPN